MAISDPSTMNSLPVTSNGIVKSPNVCWRYARGIYCPEELCHYQHGPPLQAARLPRRSAASYGRTACLFFAQGYCKHGDDCTFAHISLSGGKPESEGSRPPSNEQLTSPMSPTYSSRAPTADIRSPTSPSPHHRESGVPRSQTPRIVGESNGIPWGGPAHEGDSEGYDTKHRNQLFLDKSRSRQVYDDQNILVLSGGVMLGSPHQTHFPAPARSSRHPPLSIDPSSLSPSMMHPPVSATAPSQGSSASSSFSGDYLLTPGEWSPASNSWADDDRPMLVPTPQPGTMASWASYSFPPQTTTVTMPMPPAMGPTSSSSRHHHHPRVERVRFDDSDAGISYQVDSGAAALTSAFESLQVTSIAELGLDRSSDAGDYPSDDEADDRGHYTERDGGVSLYERRGSLPAHVHARNTRRGDTSSPSPTSAAAPPFRRSSLGAVVELGGGSAGGSPARKSSGAVSSAILRDREAHATHHRSRPSM